MINMPCGCTDRLNVNNKGPDKSMQSNNSKTLSLDSMASMSIDEIINLYKDGYRLEGLVDKVDIVSLGCGGTPTTDIYRARNQQGGIIIYKGTVGACKIVPTSKCLDFIAFYGARRYNTSYSLYFEIREHDPATGFPKGTPGDPVGLIKEINENFETTFTAYPQTITFQAELPTLGVPYWITIRSSDYICGGGTTGQERVELSYSWLAGTNRANYGPVVPCAWNSNVTDSWALETFKTTYTLPSNAQVFNVCWGAGLGTTCSIPPQQPVVPIGTNFPIKADISNNGSAGPIRAVFKANGITISDQNTPSLATGGFWSPSVNYTMPSIDVTLAIEGYGWNNSSWILAQTVVTTISKSTPTCTGISVDANTVTANVGDTITLTAYGITPSTQPYIVTFTDRNNTILGTCNTSSGTCSVQWNTTGLSEGIYYVKAAVIGQCTSTELAIGLSIPIQQWNVDINVKDSVTTTNIQGASVTVGTQTLQTDASGHVLFRVDEGTIYVTISKTGYNTVNSDPRSVYNNVTFNYSLVPVSQNPGTLRFITSPPGISGAEVHFIGDAPTLKGTTDVNGIFSIGSLVVDRVVNYEVRKTGYNTATGSKTVVGNVITDVMVTMTTLSVTGSVCIHSSPSEASIKIDNVLQTGKTTAISGGGCLANNTVGNLTAGSHSYELSLAAYQPKTGNITITVGQTLDYDAGTLTPLPTLGTANVSSTPSGARIHIMSNNIYVDTGYATGTVGSPAVIGSLIAGTYSYKLTLTEYNDYLGTFIITAGQTTVVNPTLVLTPPTTGTLSIWSFPPGAHIYTRLESGQWQDTTSITGSQINPTQITGLTPGNYSYKLTLNGYDDYIGPFVISSGQTTSANATLIQTGTSPVLASISPATPTIQIGGMQTFIAKDQNNNTITTGVVWAKTAGVGSITTAGVYSAGTIAGTATIRATYLDTTITTLITVTSAAVILTSISPANPTIQIDTTKQFLAKDQNNNTISTGVTWTKVTGSGTISTTGLYSAGSVADSIIISATHSGVTKTTSITVVEELPSEGGAGMLFGIVGVAALGIMMSSKKTQMQYKEKQK